MVPLFMLPILTENYGESSILSPYLGIAAFTMVLRRLREPGPESGGVTVLMRYTLRLLTLDQLSRATALICALELEREKQIQQLGAWPFEIGLWVGRAATPNKMGKKGDGDEYSALARTFQFKRDSNNNHGAPIPMENCPWCGQKFQPSSFHLEGPPNQPTNLSVYCVQQDCEFNGSPRMLPVVAVDEPIFRRLPAFLIATVDKFASLPWNSKVGSLFGHVDRFDAKAGYYGASEPGFGSLLKHPLHAPDLIIQDELHLISGPLGTIAGVYETAIDALCTRQIDGQSFRPKIIASTATVRRASPQIRALFGRESVDIFPPPGPNRNDSFFAKTVDPSIKAARRYVGIAAQGQSAKVIFLRTTLALLSAAQREWNHSKDSNVENSADAYMTLLGYFNSLRELGGSRRIVEDEVLSRIQDYSKRSRVDPKDNTFASRSIKYEPVELTSRVSTNEVAEAKRKLALPFDSEDRVDVALATNMISVGLDIQRLGLMVVAGQPKTAAEYIQATSRVGRADDRPGLIVTLLNIHKARDRSHYERFVNYHQSFYRSVEAASVTPFSPRALDRALAAALVGMCRHGEATLTRPEDAGKIRLHRANLEKWIDRIVERVREHAIPDGEELNHLAERVRSRARYLLDQWYEIANNASKQGSVLYYANEGDSMNQKLLHEFLHPELERLDPAFRNFRAARSMRDVEPCSDLYIKEFPVGGVA